LPKILGEKSITRTIPKKDILGLVICTGTKNGVENHIFAQEPRAHREDMAFEEGNGMNSLVESFTVCHVSHAPVAGADAAKNAEIHAPKRMSGMKAPVDFQ